MKNRTFNTLFMLSSLDGKISTGDTNERDFDKDLPKIKGIKEGLFQYYELERKTDYFSFNSGKVMDKIGVNTNKSPIKSKICSFIIVDDSHLTERGIINLINGVKKLYLVTSNKNHPAFKVKKNLEIIYFSGKINFKELFKKLKSRYGIKRITIQSGSTVNSILLREGLIDKISVVIAPCIIGGKNTPTLVDGESLKTLQDLRKVKALKLEKIKKLKNSYINLRYSVLNN